MAGLLMTVAMTVGDLVRPAYAERRSSAPRRLMTRVANALRARFFWGCRFRRNER